MEQFNIIRLTPNDWSSFSTLRKIALTESPEAFDGDFEKELNPTSEFIDNWKQLVTTEQVTYFAMLQTKSNTLVSLIKICFSDEENMYFLQAFYTLPEFRGNGFGKKLIEHGIEYVKSLGGVKVGLGVSKDQVAAVALYEKLGFKITNTVKNEIMGDNKPHDFLAMDLEL